MTSGERWTIEQLDALRDDGFTPGAWASFLGASFERAANTRRARPELARQVRAWSTIGLLSGVATSMAASRLRLAAPRPGRFALWWLATAAMLDWHLGMVEGTAGERRERLTEADALTLLRLWLVPLLAAQGNRARRSGPAFAILVCCAAASDALDGAAARRAGPTRLGRDFDTLADALVSAVAAHAAWRAGWLPRRVARLAVIRSSVPGAYAAGIYFRTGRRSMVDTLGTSRELAPALLGGLAAAPFTPRAAAALTTGASLISLGLVVARPTLAYLAQTTDTRRRTDANSHRADRQHPASARADRRRTHRRSAGRA